MIKGIFHRTVNLIFLLLVCPAGITALYAQSEFVLKGDANSIGSGCYQITPDAGNKAGMATNLYPINLATTFSLSFTMNFGTTDAGGADGMTFLIGTDCNPSLGTGASIGVSSTSNPSIIAEFDTYQNTGFGADDIADDHINLYKNGSLATANQLNGAPVAAGGAGVNIEDGVYHNVIIKWTYNSATSQTISVSFDGVVRKTATGNYLAALFGGTNLNYWSITGSTGGSSNNQSFCYTTSNSKTSCAGDLIKFGAPVNGTNYSWSSTPITSPINGQGTDSIRVTPSVSTVYTCSFKDACSINRSLQFNATVNPLPTATLSSTDACLNIAPATVVFTGAGATAPYTFTYTVNGGTNQTIISSGTTNTISISIPPTTATSYTYALVSVKESSSTTCSQTQSVSKVVTINPMPTASITGDTTVCRGATSPLVTFKGTNGTSPYTFTYNISGGTNQTVISNGTGTATLDVSTNAPTTFTYNLVSVKDNSIAGCSQTQNGSAVITVNPSPTGTLTTNVSAVCLGATTPTITFTGLTGNAPFTFNYSINDGTSTTTTTITATGTNTTVVVPTTVAGIFTYSLLSISDNLCSQSQTGSALVKVNSVPTASISGTETVCPGTTKYITFTGASGIAPYTFTYKINGAGTTTLQGNSTQTLSINTATPGNTYTVVLIRVQDASSTTCSQNQPDTAIVSVKQQSTGTLTTTINRVCIGTAPLPDITFTGGSGPAPYVFTYTTDTLKNNIHTSIITHTLATSSTTTTVAVPTNNADTIVYIFKGIADNSGLTCPIIPDTAQMIIDPRPQSVITSTLGANQCEGQSGGVKITFSPGIGIGGHVTYNYTTQWGLTPAAAATASVTSHPPLNPMLSNDTTLVELSLPLGTTIYSNGISSSNVCAGTGTGTLSITVHPSPTATISLIGANTICQTNTSDTVLFTGSVGQPPFTYSYIITGGSSQKVGSITSSSLTAMAKLPIDTVAGTYTYSLTAVHDAYGCTQPQTGSVTVVVDPLQQASAGGRDTICMNTTATVSGASAAYGSISWSAVGSGGGSINSGNTLTPSYSPITADEGKAIILTMTVSSTNSCSSQPAATATYTINVNPLPTATLTGGGTICQSATATTALSFNGANGTYPYTFNYTQNGGTASIISPNTTTVLTISAATATTYTTILVSVTDANGCSQTVTTNNTALVRINPSVSGAIASNSTVCQSSTLTGPSVVFTGSNGNPPYKFTYSINGTAQPVLTTLTGSNTISVTAPIVTSGTFTYSLVTVEDDNNGGCGSVTTSSIVITVDSLPLAIVTGSITTCQIVPVTVPASAAFAKYGSISWSAAGSGTDNITYPTSLTPTYTPLASDAGKTIILTMTVTSSNSCIGQTAIGTYTIALDSLPLALSGNNTTICQNANYTLRTGDATAKYGSINWTTNSSGAGNITNGNTLTPTYAPVASDAGKAVILTMTVSSINTCSTSAQPTATATYTINVDKLPTATSAKSTTICENNSYTLQNDEATMANASVLSWATNGSGSIVSGFTSLTPTYKADAADAGKTVTLTLTVTSDNTCSGETANANYTIHVNPLPTATINHDEEVCHDSIPRSIVLKGLNGTPPYTFNLTINNDPIAMKAYDSISIKAPTNKTGLVTYALVNVMDVNGCSQAQNVTATVTVHENPHAIFTISPERTSILEPEITITDASIAATAYVWYFGDGKFSSLSNPLTHIYADTGTYKIKLTVSNGLCKDSTSEIVRIILPLSLYVPNSFSPNGDGVNDVFKAEGDGITKFEMFIYDRWGQLIFHTDDINKGWDGKVNERNDVAQIDSYVYVINLRALANKHDYTYRGVVNLMR